MAYYLGKDNEAVISALRGQNLFSPDRSPGGQKAPAGQKKVGVYGQGGQAQAMLQQQTHDPNDPCFKACMEREARDGDPSEDPQVRIARCKAECEQGPGPQDPIPAGCEKKTAFEMQRGCQKTDPISGKPYITKVYNGTAYCCPPDTEENKGTCGPSPCKDEKGNLTGGGYKTTPDRGCKEGETLTSHTCIDATGKQVMETWCCPVVDPESPCPQKNGRLLPSNATACKQGETMMTDAQGRKWCCPAGDGKGCEGGYPFKDEFKGGQGSGKALWTQHGLTAQDGWYRSADWGAHQIWHPEWGFQDLVQVLEWKKGKRQLTKNEGGACQKGYKKTTMEDGSTWCCPEDISGGGQQDLGEYGYPDWMKRLMEMLSGRAESMLNRPYGFSQDEKDQRFGKGFEKIRGQEAPARDSLMRALSSQGMLGTGAGMGQLGQLASGAENTVTDLRRDLFLEEEEKKKRDELDFTGMANQLFGTGMGYEGMLEAMNAGRRGEGRDWIRMYLEMLRGMR